MKDELGDILKKYEKEAEGYPSGESPIVVRLDGKNFSKWTKGLAKPYDARMVTIMTEVSEVLLKFCNASVAFSQSDEITLILTKPSENGEMLFGGRYQKLSSVLASLATYTFNRLVEDYIPEKSSTMALFDARTFEVPDIKTAVDSLKWRAEDCRRNSVSCLAQTEFSHKQLQNKNVGQMKKMLKEINKDWENTPDFYRNGVYVSKKIVENKLTDIEIGSLPKMHLARRNPDMTFKRSVIDISYDSILDAEDPTSFINK